MKQLFVATLIVVIFGLTSCETKLTQIISLPVVLENIKQVETASYISSSYFCYSGDTVPIDRKMVEYYKEYASSSDTSVGASFMRFDVEDTTKMIYAYDGKIEARINWQENHFRTNDFSNNSFRRVMAPFFAKSKALIEYALSTEDSLHIDSIVHESNVAYKISIINERVEFVGRLPIHINELGSNDGIISEYVIWVNRETKLPFKLQRTLPANTLIDEIKNLKTNHLSKENFSISKYIPEDMPRRTGKEQNATEDLINTTAFNYTLQDMEGQFQSLDDVSSKVYMINLTSMFCGPCGMSVSFLKELNQKYDKKDFSFVSLYVENEKKGLLKYIKEKEITYNVLLADKQTEEKYKLSLFPTFLILDKDRKIRKVISGFKKGVTELEMEKAIEELF
ncbi:MAG: TlpA family protein disulfide reductase [Salinivirgaceae bacterium]|nr:TlpA family protein disulfide reductase [Salinivirgaceae bacterium]